MKVDRSTSNTVRIGLLRRVPVDCAAVALYALVVDLLVVAVGPSWLRLVFVLPLLFFLPGYTLVASLYPAGRHAAGTGLEETGITTLERIGLSFGLSLVVVPLVGVGLWRTSWGSSVATVVMALTLFVFVTATVGAYRRLSLPPKRRFQLPYGRLREAVGRGFDSPSLDAVVDGVLVLSVLLAVALLGYGLVNPMDGESYTSVALLSENTQGEMVAAGYPSSFVAGEGQPLALELANEEGAETTYTVFVRVERMRTQGGDPTVVEFEEVDRFTERVGPGDSQTIRRSVAPTLIGDRLRLSYYVYRGQPADPVGADTAYRHLFIWIDVEDG